MCECVFVGGHLSVCADVEIDSDYVEAMIDQHSLYSPQHIFMI